MKKNKKNLKYLNEKDLKYELIFLLIFVLILFYIFPTVRLLLLDSWIFHLLIYPTHLIIGIFAISVVYLVFFAVRYFITSFLTRVRNKRVSTTIFIIINIIGYFIIMFFSFYLAINLHTIDTFSVYSLGWFSLFLGFGFGLYYSKKLFWDLYHK